MRLCSFLVFYGKIFLYATLLRERRLEDDFGEAKYR